MAYRRGKKGSELSECQAHELVQILDVHDVLFIAVVVDSKLQSKADINLHKKRCAEHILNNVSEHHHPNVAQQITNFSKEVSALHNQLYVQYSVMDELICKVHQLSTLYYVQRSPQELSAFHWIIDAKDKQITKAEKAWKSRLAFFIQGYSLKEPLRMLPGEDYSFYGKFDSSEGNGGDIKKIMENMEFADSKNSEGLQLVDVLTSVLNKALNGRFGILGWGGIGRLMTQFGSFNVVSLMSLNVELVHSLNVPYAHVFKKLNDLHKRLLVDEALRKDKIIFL